MKRSIFVKSQFNFTFMDIHCKQINFSDLKIIFIEIKFTMKLLMLIINQI